jgi:hypothetical protein
MNRGEAMKRTLGDRQEEVYPELGFSTISGMARGGSK